MRVVLASGSPRRRELMKRIFLDFEVITSNVDERTIEEKLENDNRDISKIDLGVILTERLSCEKARDVFLNLKDSNSLVIGADTTVCLEDEILGKPKNKEDAIRMLKKESILPQFVITGVTIVTKEKTYTFNEKTKVVFKELDEAQERRIIEYCNTDCPYDKAGAYGIQDESDELVSYYEGDYDNIVGFPIKKIREVLISEFGMNIKC